MGFKRSKKLCTYSNFYHLRDLLAKNIAHLRDESSFSARTVYDLDCLVFDKTQILTSWKTIGNDDKNRYYLNN